MSVLVTGRRIFPLTDIVPGATRLLCEFDVRQHTDPATLVELAVEVSEDGRTWQMFMGAVRGGRHALDDRGAPIVVATVNAGRFTSDNGVTLIPRPFGHGARARVIMTTSAPLVTDARVLSGHRASDGRFLPLSSSAEAIQETAWP